MVNIQSNKTPFFLIAGPCVIEDKHTPLQIAEKVKKITDRLEIPLVFKASYKKANRSSIKSFTGIGDEPALQVLKDIKERTGLLITTDIHSEEEASRAAAVVDILQIPAFLCRQTSLLTAAGATGKTVNIKKGQFMSPNAMEHAVQKIRIGGNNKVWLTERGNSFGYEDLVVDYRNIPIMKRFGTPVIMDCTHALQKPNQASGITGGQPEFITIIAKAAMAAGADGLFIETHPDPKSARSDGHNMLPLDQLEELLVVCKKIAQVVN